MAEVNPFMDAPHSRENYLRQLSEETDNPFLAAPTVKKPSLGERVARHAGNVGLSVGQGYTMGTGDELAAAGMTGVAALAPETSQGQGISPSYSENLKTVRERLEEIPWYEKIPGEMIGGTAAAITAGPAVAATKVGQAAMKLPAWLKVMGLGGLFGGLFGFGESEGGLENRAAGAVVGLPLGAATGGVLHGGLRTGQT